MVDLRDGKGFVVVGATTGQVIASQIGGIGVVGGFGGMALGTPVIVVRGAIAGAAIQGILEGIETGDAKILGVTTVGSVLGAGFSAAVGKVGVGIAGNAFGIGMGTMAATGGLFALGVYQLIKMFAQQERKESVEQIFGRMEDRISGQEFYNQAMMELDPMLGEMAWMQKMADLEIEEELQQLKATIKANLREDNFGDYEWQPLENEDELQTLKQELKTYLQQDICSTKVIYDSTQTGQKQGQIITINTPDSSWQSSDITHFESHVVNAVGIAPNNQYLFSGDNKGIINLWDLNTHKLLFSFISGREEIQTIAISPNSNKLLAAGFDRRINSWNIQQKSIFIGFHSLRSHYSHEGVIYALAISPDGKWIASGSSDNKIKIWDAITGKWERTLNDHSDTILALTFSSDGQTLVSGSADKTIRLWDVKNYPSSKVLNSHCQRITCLELTDSDRYLVSGSSDGVIQIWDLESQNIVRTITNDEHLAILSLSVNIQANILATANHKKIQLWDLQTGKLLQILVGCHPIRFSHDGKILVSGTHSPKEVLKIWRYKLGQFEDNKNNNLVFDPSHDWWEV